MTSLFQQFKTDEGLERNGVWLNFGSVEIKVLRAGGGNVEYAKVAQRYFEPHRRSIELKLLDETTANKLLVEIYTDCVIVGWRTKLDDGTHIDTIEGPDGADLAFNKANVMLVMTAIPELFRFVRQYSEDWQTFKIVSRDIAAKN